MPNGEDHDRIIRMEGKVDTICSSIKRIEEIQEKLFTELKDQKLQCDNKSTHDQDACRACQFNLTEKIDKKVNWGKFIAVITLVLGIFAGSLGWMTSTMTDNRDKVMILTHTVEDHIKHAEDFYKRFPEVIPQQEDVDSN